MTSKQAGKADLAVAARIRMHRKALGLSQTELASKLGVTFQQVQKYERGANRIGAGRLYELAQIFGVPITSLFPPSHKQEASSKVEGPGLQQIAALVSSADGWRLCKAFLKIEAPEVRKSLVALAEELAAS